LALSDTEASVVAPFTSRKKSPLDVLALISEGRCALQTSLNAFKLMVIYPVIQLAQAVLLYSRQSTLGDFQYLYVDLVLVLPLALLQTLSGACPQLSRRRPTASLFHTRILLSLAFQAALVIVLLLFLNRDVAQQSWYVPSQTNATEADLKDNVVGYERSPTLDILC
jgi:cation-transporting ATPase 13A2